MTDPLHEALREAYTLLVSAEPTLIRDAKWAPNAVSAHYKALLRDRVAEWLEPYRDHFEEGLAVLAAPPPPRIDPAKAERAALVLQPLPGQDPATFEATRRRVMACYAPSDEGSAT